jgi:DNA-directed RNA polymerase specialized sigma subunit
MSDYLSTCPSKDLYSVGVLGLLDAFGRFDSSKQVEFRTYAQFRIRGAILDSLRTTSADNPQWRVIGIEPDHLFARLLRSDPSLPTPHNGRAA